VARAITTRGTISTLIGVPTRRTCAAAKTDEGECRLKPEAEVAWNVLVARGGCVEMPVFETRFRARAGVACQIKWALPGVWGAAAAPRKWHLDDNHVSCWSSARSGWLGGVRSRSRTSRACVVSGCARRRAPVSRSRSAGARGYKRETSSATMSAAGCVRFERDALSGPQR
jgi:hypothetical protein